jgi:hypothetical protein
VSVLGRGMSLVSRFENGARVWGGDMVRLGFGGEMEMGRRLAYLTKEWRCAAEEGAGIGFL